ncbi:uncharacterized protein LOC125444004 [Sphaerodactylus townsendi]|uniref:uncharacterized protein LOC125444004 n=1 Tax=Sphaerodactylus townsendi TaxID=933632 RepID=UPI0020275733|nr:uncharacterized protein LOC125444004 [Sphaerodactylus townsendi]
MLDARGLRREMKTRQGSSQAKGAKLPVLFHGNGFTLRPPRVYKESSRCLLAAKFALLLQNGSERLDRHKAKPGNRMPFQVVALLLVSLSFVLMEENGTRANTKILQRRYSEGTIVSDYSKTLDSMLKKKFVDLLLKIRENRMENSIDPSKREVESPIFNTNSQGFEAGSQGTKDFFICLLQQSLILPNGSNQWKDLLKKEFLDCLISADLCRPIGSPAHTVTSQPPGPGGQRGEGCDAQQAGLMVTPREWAGCGRGGDSVRSRHRAA